MKVNSLRILTLAASLFLLSSCGTLKSESGLYGDNIELEHTYKVPVKGFWVSEKTNPHAKDKNISFYIAPLDVKAVEKESPEGAKAIAPLMHKYMYEETSRSLANTNKKMGVNWTLTNNPNDATFVIETAVVKLKPQHPTLKFLNSTVGWLIPIPGLSTVAGQYTNGAICIECIIRDGANKNQIYFAFKDANRKKTRIYHKDAYSVEGQADKNLKHWAESIARLITASNATSSSTNSIKKNIEEKIANRKFSDVVKSYGANSIK